MLFPKNVDIDQKAIKELGDLYRQTYADLKATLDNASDFTVARNGVLMGQIQNRLQRLGVQTGDWINANVPPQYQKGVEDIAAQMAHLDVPLAQTTMSLINHQSVAAIMSDMSNKFGTAITTIQKSTESIISAGVRQQIRNRLATGQLVGASRKEVSASIKQALSDDGIFALRDAGGKRWSLDTYAEMLARTKMVEARNTGVTDMMQQNGYSLVQVSAHGAEDVCGPWEDAILSVDGTDDDYPSLDDAISSGLFHPNCKHSINAISDPTLAQQTYKYNPATGEYANGTEALIGEDATV